jgi:hypothetical protein
VPREAITAVDANVVEAQRIGLLAAEARSARGVGHAPRHRILARGTTSEPVGTARRDS